MTSRPGPASPVAEEPPWVMQDRLFMAMAHAAWQAAERADRDRRLRLLLASLATGNGQLPRSEPPDPDPGAAFEERMSAAYEVHRGLWAHEEPTTLNERIWHRKRYDRRPILRTYCDREAVQSHASARLGPRWIPRCLGFFDDPDDVRRAWSMGSLGDEIVLKATHGSGGMAALWTGPTLPGRGDAGWFRRTYDRDDVPWDALCADLRGLQQRDFGSDNLEWGYLGVPRRLMVQELLRGEGGALPPDLKCLVFAGRVEVLYQALDRVGTAGGIGFYDREWSRLPVRGLTDPAEFPRPQHLTDILDAAEELAADEDFVRVDFLLTDRGPVFAEVTPYHVAGMAVLHPSEWHVRLGDLWPDPGRRTRS